MADRKSSLEYCDDGLGLNMQMQPTTTESSSSFSSSYYPCKRTMGMLPPTTQQPSSEGTIAFNGYDEDGSSNCVCGPSLSDLYYAAAAPTSSWPEFTTSFNSSGAVFTASQRQEFERQAMIYKYMMASVPVPSQLPPKNQFSGPISQSTTSVLDLRFSNSTDQEPWRCRRTDGKKWRCSRNAMLPSQKYCERHAHKSKARSRKPVEIHQSHQANSTTNNNNSSEPNVFPVNTSTSSSSQPLRISPLIGGSPVSYNQTRGGGIELFTKGGLSNHQWQHPLHSSPGMELGRNNLELNKERNCNFQVQHREDNNPGGSQEWETRYCNSNLDSKMAFLNANTTQTTRHFIDAMSTGEKRGLDKVCEKEPVNSSRKLPFSSLTLSMPGVNEIDREDHHENRDTDTTRMMMMGLARNGQWMNPVTWMDATPGGPLGEAMCLGSVSSSAKGRDSGLPSPHGYSNSSMTTSRSSCEDGSQAHNFIG